jgi:hypothetical protein
MPTQDQCLALDYLRQIWRAGHGEFAGRFDGFVRDGEPAIGPWLNLGQVPTTKAVASLLT